MGPWDLQVIRVFDTQCFLTWTPFNSHDGSLKCKLEFNLNPSLDTLMQTHSGFKPWSTPKKLPNQITHLVENFFRGYNRVWVKSMIKMKHCQCGTVFMPNLVIPTQEITSPNKVTCNVTKNRDNIHTYESLFHIWYFPHVFERHKWTKHDTPFVFILTMTKSILK